jgi:hypothetical protein
VLLLLWLLLRQRLYGPRLPCLLLLVLPGLRL